MVWCGGQVVCGGYLSVDGDGLGVSVDVVDVEQDYVWVFVGQCYGQVFFQVFGGVVYYLQCLVCVEGCCGLVWFGLLQCEVCDCLVVYDEVFVGVEVCQWQWVWIGQVDDVVMYLVVELQ